MSDLYDLGVRSYGPGQEGRVGFFTDTSICIGCKACEVACKEWNQIPADELRHRGFSMDNTGGLDADTWRHVAFVEQRKPLGADGDLLSLVAQASLNTLADEGAPIQEDGSFRWLMSSDVCKHCTNAACLEVCPTGALFRTEFGTVVVQEDICNGCGYCIPACPFGVLGQRGTAAEGGGRDGRAWKCTLCYDRLKDDREPACAKACPTDSIQFGPLDELRERANARVSALHAAGEPGAQLYLADEDDGIGGGGAFFLLLDEPEVYGLPPDPLDTTHDLPETWKAVGVAAGIMLAAVLASFGGARNR